MRFPFSRRFKLWLALGLLACTAVTAGLFAASRASMEVYKIQRLAKTPAIDGVIDAEWQIAQVVYPTRPLAGREPTAIRLAYDDTWFYIGVDCTDSQLAPPQDDIWQNDVVWGIVRIGQQETDRAHQFHFRVTPHGRASVRFHRGPTPAMREVFDFTKDLNPDQYRLGVARTPQGWSVELALAWAAIEPRIPVLAEPFSAFVGRRNTNGTQVEVGEWPYETAVGFKFVEPSGKQW